MLVHSRLRFYTFELHIRFGFEGRGCAQTPGGIFLRISSAGKCDLAQQPLQVRAPQAFSTHKVCARKRPNKMQFSV
jgi:hypothetical protein